MVFSSLTFLLLFMPGVLLGYRFIPAKGRMPFLLAASLLFYGWGNPGWLLLLGWCVLVSWGGTLVLNRLRRGRKAVLALVIILDLLPLVRFKYTGFLCETIRALTGWEPGARIPALPAGISFFTFQALSYVLDVWRGNAKAQRSPVVFGVYLSLFPQLTAGPVVRYREMEAQLAARPRPTWEQMRGGLNRFCTGLAKKVLLADALGRFWGQMNADFSRAGALGAWLGLIAFSFQIYFDFSGYSDMAIGLGKALGFELPENFDRPYRAKSLTEFWRRWHISLTAWFTDYVYIPLGGNRRGAVRRDLNLAVVWALTGLWHGAGWHFVLWGLYFAALLILEKRAGERRPAAAGRRRGRASAFLRQGATYLAVLLGWGLFSGFGEPLFRAMAGGMGLASPRAALACAAYAPLIILCAALSFAPRVPELTGRRFAAPVLMVLCLAAIAAQSYAPFIYFQF